MPSTEEEGETTLRAVRVSICGVWGLEEWVAYRAEGVGGDDPLKPVLDNLEVSADGGEGNGNCGEVGGLYCVRMREACEWRGTYIENHGEGECADENNASE